MMRFIRKEFKFTNNILEGIKFCIVGGGATLIHYVVYILLMNSVPSYNITYTIGYIVSLSFNFLASSYFTFRVKPTIQRAKKFILAHMINYINQVVLLNVFILCKIPQENAPILVFIITIGINFIMVKKSLTNQN